MASTSSIWNSLSAAPRARFFFLAFPISGVRAVLVERLKYIQRLQSPDCQKKTARRLQVLAFWGGNSATCLGRGVWPVMGFATVN
jgi:hypothetical protein